MNVFNKRYFVLIALILLGFTAFSLKFNNLISIVFLLGFIAILLVALAVLNKRFKNIKLLCVILMLTAIWGIIGSRTLAMNNDYFEEKYSGEHIITGYVAEVSVAQNFMSEYIVKVEAIDYQKVSLDLVLVANYQCDLVRGDFFELKGKILPLENYSDTIYLQNKNVYDYPLICTIDDRVEIEYLEDEFRISLWLSNLNSRLSSNLKVILGKDAGSLASALLLGNRELLEDDMLRDFKRAGVYHMLALSGLHVAILIGIFDWLFKKLFIPRGIRIGILSFVSLFYVALTGFALSACRAMLMLWVMYLALTLSKRRDAMTALFVAISVIVIISPSAVFDIGLQLSFLSTFGVICSTLICEKIKWFQKDIDGNKFKVISFELLRKFVSVNIASLCVFIMTLPILMIYFGEVSLATFITNIFMGVICEIFMMFSLLALLLSFNSYLCFPFAEISAWVGELMNEVVGCISNIDAIMLSLSYPKIEYLVWGLFLAFLILLTVSLSRKWLIFAPSVIFVVLLCINIADYNASREGFVRAEYIAHDNVIFSSGNEVYICDASNGSYGALFESVVIAKENCFTEIDGIILSHYHSNHIVSIERLAKNYKIDSVLLPYPQNSEEDMLMRSIVRVLDDEGVNTYIYDNSKEIDILSGKLAISPRAYIAGYAHPSVALSFSFGEERLTLLGRPYFDTYLEESGVFKKYVENSDYLIFGADGRDVQGDFYIFSSLKENCEISFSDFDFMEKSDFESFMDEYKIYFDVQYKKYDLK